MDNIVAKIFRLKIVSQLRSSEGLRQSLFVTVSNLFGTVIAAVAFIILSRLLDPQAFGLFSIGFALIVILSKIADAGINVALQKKIAPIYNQQPKHTQKFINQAVWLKGFLTIIVLITTSLSAPVIAPLFNIPNIAVIYISILSTVFVVMYEFIVIVLQSFNIFTPSIIMNILQASVKFTGILLMFLLSFRSVMFALLIFSMAPLIAAIQGFLSLPNIVKHIVKEGKKERQELLALAKYTCIVPISMAITDNLDTLLVQRFMTTYDTGIFSAANRVALLFSMVAYSLAMVLNPRVARYAQGNHLALFLQKSKKFSLIAMAGMTGILPFSELLLLFTAGHSYLGGTFSLQILLLAAAAQIITTPFTAIFYALDRPNYFAISSIAQIIILVIGDVVLTPAYGIAGASTAKFITRFSIFAFSFVYALYAVGHHQKTLSTHPITTGK